jgi:hypothetical protein
MLFLAQTALFMLALAGIGSCSIAMLYFAGRALSRARSAPLRWRAGALAALCLCGIVASAAAGFVGVPALLYLAAQ